MSVIELNDVSVTFHEGGRTVEAVKHVNISVEKGEIFGIVGFSGAGKSTLVRTINLLERPTGGHVVIDGSDITALKGGQLRDLRKKIGFIFQGFNLITNVTVGKNIEFALKAGGYTVAVLGTAIDKIYPIQNEGLFADIEDRGLILSEYYPSCRTTAGSFPERNRIISGLSRGVIVVEAREKSGTFITVDCALEQGRDVFAIPGRVSDELSMGTNNLIREGLAKITLGAEDELEEYGIKPMAEERKAVTPAELSFEQELIHRLLMAGERTYDELAELTGFDAGMLNSTLTAMEFSGIIKQSVGRLFSL